MSASIPAILKKFKLAHLVEVKRRLKHVGRTTGFVVDVSEPLVLFQTLDTDTFRLNGYTVLRGKDISHYRAFAKAAYWQFRAVRHFRLRPSRPIGISIVSLPEFLRSVSRHYPLLTIHPERTKPDICYIGRYLSATDQTLLIDDLNCNGEWSGPRRIKLNDITRVDFGGGYEAALAVTAPKRPKARERVNSKH